MTNTINQSFREVYDIIEHMEKKIYNKIPIQFIEMLKKNMDTNYYFDIDYSKKLNEQKLLKDTKIILSIIYRDYICSEEEKRRLREKDRLDLIKYENELREKYNPNNIFKTKKSDVIESSSNNSEYTEMIEYKESIFIRIKNFLNKVFKK